MARQPHLTPAERAAIFDDANWRGGPCFELRLRASPGQEHALAHTLLHDQSVVLQLPISPEDQPEDQIDGLHTSVDVALRLDGLPAMGFRAIGLHSAYVELVTYPLMVERTCGLSADDQDQPVGPNGLLLYRGLASLAVRIHTAVCPLRAEISWEAFFADSPLADGLILPKDVAALLDVRADAVDSSFASVSWQNVRPLA